MIFYNELEDFELYTFLCIKTFFPDLYLLLPYHRVFRDSKVYFKVFYLNVHNVLRHYNFLKYTKLTTI